MKRERFFRSNWNAKTVLILTAALAAFGVLSIISYKIYKDMTRTRQVQNVVNVEPSTRFESEWELGKFESLDGTDFVMAPAHSKQNYQTSYYEKDASAVRNYLFVNTADKSSRWLVPTNKYLFITAERLLLKNNLSETRSLKQTENNYNGKPVKWMKYEIVKSDSDQDGRFTVKDKRTIAFSSVTGEGYTEVIDDVEQILGSMLLDDDTLLSFHSTGGSSYVSEVNLPSSQVTVKRELPKIQPE